MRAGRLRHRVTIQQPTEAGAAAGNVTKTWSTYKETWAEIEPLSGREFFEGAALDREITARIRMRYLSGLTADMRIVRGGVESNGDPKTGADVWDIQSVINVDQRNRELEVMAIR